VLKVRHHGAATARGFRVLKVRHHGDLRTEPLPIVGE